MCSNWVCLLNAAYFLSCQLLKNWHWAYDPTLLYINNHTLLPLFLQHITQIQPHLLHINIHHHMWARLCLHPRPNSCCAWNANFFATANIIFLLGPSPYAPWRRVPLFPAAPPNQLMHCITWAQQQFLSSACRMHFLHLNFSLGRDSCIRRCSPICERRRVPTSHFFSSHLGLLPSRVSPSVTLEQLFLLMRFLLFAYAPSSNSSKARASLGFPFFAVRTFC